MKTIVQGKKVTNKWSVDTGKEKQIINGEEREIFVKKPSLTKEEEIEWVDICEYNAEPQHTGMSFFANQRIYLSETEEVVVDREIFRADLGVWYQRTDKILDEVDAGKEEAETELQTLVAEFNKTVIENDAEMLNYCKLHKLTPEETDAGELYSLLHPDKKFKFDIVQQTYRGVNLPSNDIYMASSEKTIDDEIRNIRKALYGKLSEFEVDVSAEDEYEENQTEKASYQFINGTSITNK